MPRRRKPCVFWLSSGIEVAANYSSWQAQYVLTLGREVGTWALALALALALVDLQSLPVWVNLGIFALAAGTIWVAGTRLTAYADIISERTGLGSAFIGLVLLAGATSLPEIGRTVTSASIGNAPLAIDSLFGGITLQTAILAVGDLAIGKEALTFVAPQPILLLEGALLVVILALALAGMAAGPIFSPFEIDFWTVLLVVAYLLLLYLLRRYEGHGRWRPVDMPELPANLARIALHDHYRGSSIKQVFWFFGLAAIIVLFGGVALTPVGDALGRQTGLGAGFVGATLLALATSLPELSTTLAAVRLGAYSLAVSNIFGSNALLVALIFVADVFYRPGPVLAAVDRSAIFAAAIGICVTGIYMAGLIERRNQSIWRMGLDSMSVLILYLGSVLILYYLR